MVQAPNRFVLQWVKDRFLPVIEQLARDHRKGLRSPFRWSSGIVSAAPTMSTSTQPLRPHQIAASQTPRQTSRLNPSFTFDSFVTGKANQLARAAALQVAEHPGTAYNPLFIYGGVGLGKTHLLQAIGNLVQERNPQAKIRYIHAEQYVSDVVRAYQHKAFDGFKKYYHSLDLLLIDDIQFFSGKNRTQEEFFYAFNALIEAHKQVIITCDTYPKEISGMEDRLISRFGWGLTVAIEPPGARDAGGDSASRRPRPTASRLPEDVAFFIAKHIQSNVRELEGRSEARHRVLELRRPADHRRAGARGAQGPAGDPVPPDLHRQHPADRCRLLQDQGRRRCTRRNAHATSPGPGRWRWRWRRSSPS